jgi:hypothetical protein
VTHCCNPVHLEPTTHAENVRRGDGGRVNREKTRCPQGHPYDRNNTRLYRRADGKGMGRACRTCANEKARAGYDPAARAARHRARMARRDAA